jgi:CheY-like chemotaxis protein/nitrogen-specific signal transduction histidine kinase
MPTREVSLLLVDDDPSSIQSMSRILARYPNKRFATSGEDALRLAREEPPDLIVVDVVMPGMSGLDLCEALKADARLTDVPVLFATSYGGPLLREAALKRGAVDVLAKPLMPSQLVAQVQDQLRSRWLLDATPDTDLDQPEESSPKPSPRTRPLLLIVDDDIASIHILRHMLADMGDFHFASSGKEALRLARRLLPDLILLDVHMPGLDGFEVCSALKADAAFGNVPIVFVTRFSDPQNEKRALELGAVDFIAKPYSRAVLQARVRNVLGVKRRMDADRAAAQAHWQRIGDARVAAIVAGASDAILSCDSKGHVVLINGAACGMFGVTHEEAIGMPIAALLGLAGPPEARWPGLPTRDVLRRAGGELFPVEACVSVVGEDGERLTTVTLRDIGDRERLEAQSRLRLEAETAHRASVLMMAYIAHEIGNPLAGVLGFAELMASDTRHPLAPEQARRVDLILASGRNLQDLMRDVMDLGRSATGKLAVTLCPVDVFRSVTVAVEALSALAARAEVTISTDFAASPALVSADRGRLHQCLVNLLSNAIKYNRAGGWVRVEVKSADERVLIAVSDNGIGMSPDQLHHLFEPFNRLGREGAAAYGSGLGLVVTRQLALAMNGELRVESELATGSVFTIVLAPWRDPDEATDPIPADANVAPS